MPKTSKFDEKRNIFNSTNQLSLRMCYKLQYNILLCSSMYKNNLKTILADYLKYLLKIIYLQSIGVLTTQDASTL